MNDWRAISPLVGAGRTARAALVALAAASFAACAATPPPPVEVSLDRPAPVVAAPAASPMVVAGPSASAARESPNEPEIWEGEYTCPQGITALTLRVTRHDESSMEAIFMFSASDANPGVPSGSYTLVGELRPDRSFELTPSRWIDQPPRYVMVGMAGDIDPGGTVMRGRITEDVCGSFELHRVR